MAYETLLVEQRNHVTYVTLNRPIALNALNTSLRRDLKQLFTDIQADPEARVVVITGAGRAFCAGPDIKAWREPTSVAEDRADPLQLNCWQAMSLVKPQLSPRSTATPWVEAARWRCAAISAWPRIGRHWG